MRLVVQKPLKQTTRSLQLVPGLVHETAFDECRRIGTVLGHEITGEVIEKGVDVEFLDVGDIVSVPFNVACGRCRTCRAGDTGVCLTVNPGLPGGAYGYVDMGGWIGGQARYVMTPYADFNLLKLPDRDQALAKIRDLTMLTDIIPRAFTPRSGRRSALVRPCISRAAGRLVWRRQRPRAFSVQEW